ncbi:hypothetical protein [Neobacillus mesonae]|uniref:hypothetical protein n=1 Tax=Neobacillus mesonae TaxID=1193713 RepID=UPI0025728FC7|nr:hypothetical protein [Neobacillus mesonae]
MEKMTIEEIMSKSKFVRENEVEKIIVCDNYGIVFTKQDDLETDLTSLYEIIAKVIYRQAKNAR